MKNKNNETKKAIVDYMTWSSPMNQLFMMEALGRDSIEVTYQGNETNTDKVKQAIKLHGAQRILTALTTYATAILEDRDAVRKAMKNGFINPAAWIRSAEEALEIGLVTA